MNKNAELTVVEHQKRHEIGEEACLKGHLVHRLVVRTDSLLVPPPQTHAEALGDPGAQLLCSAAGCVDIEVDVRVITGDLADSARQRPSVDDGGGHSRFSFHAVTGSGGTSLKPSAG